jgi:DNA-binding response OmpR family regulator
MARTWKLRELFVAGRKRNVQNGATDCSDEVVEVGEFRIDTGRHRVTLRGEPLELTGEEFDVLVFLTANPQSFVTPQTMLATNWGGGRPHRTEFLRVLLSLRRKLENMAAGQHYLRAEPWVIYRFDPNRSSDRLRHDNFVWTL